MSVGVYAACVSADHGLHHVGLVVPQGLHGVEDVHNVLLPDHLTDAAHGTEGPGTPPARAREGEREGGRARERGRDLEFLLTSNGTQIHFTSPTRHTFCLTSFAVKQKGTENQGPSIFKTDSKLVCWACRWN